MISLKSGVKLTLMKNILLWIKERIRLTFSDIFSFSAKASGGDFFTMIIVGLIISSIVFAILGLVAGVLIQVFNPLVLSFPKSLQTIIHILSGAGVVIVIIIVFGYIQLANICRRLNDLDRDRWWACLILIPGLNILFELYLIFMPGKDKKIKSEKILVDSRLEIVPECQGDDYKQWTSCKGKVTYPGGDIYYGEFTKGKRWGKGIWTSADGTITKGTWKNDEMIEKE